MYGAFGFPPTNTGDQQIFEARGDVGAGARFGHIWIKPPGVTMVHMFILTPGAGGGGAFGAASGDRGGGGGGGSGASHVYLFPAYAIPDRLQLQVGQGGTAGVGSTAGAAATAGGNGGRTIIGWPYQVATTTGLLLNVNGATGGGAGASAAGGAGGGAGAVGTSIYPTLTFGLITTINGVAGGAGSGNGTIGSDSAATTRVWAAGGGGAGISNAGTRAAGGNSIGPGVWDYISDGLSPGVPFFDALGGAAGGTAGGDGDSGVFPGWNCTNAPWWVSGGAGGGSGTTTGGNGGKGAKYGSGGGGGAAGATGGNGGIGGDGVIIITSW